MSLKPMLYLRMVRTRARDFYSAKPCPLMQFRSCALTFRRRKACVTKTTRLKVRSKPEKLNESKCFPLFTQQRTSPRYFGMSVSCHERKWPGSFDHLGGEREQLWRNVETKRLCGLEVDDEVKPSRLHHR